MLLKNSSQHSNANLLGENDAIRRAISDWLVDAGIHCPLRNGSGDRKRVFQQHPRFAQLRSRQLPLLHGKSSVRRDRTLELLAHDAREHHPKSKRRRSVLLLATKWVTTPNVKKSCANAPGLCTVNFRQPILSVLTLCYTAARGFFMSAAPAARLRPRRLSLQTQFPRRRGFQRAFFCSCGRPLETRLSLCRVCSWEAGHSQRYVGGHRAQVLERDGRCCRTCGAGQLLHVHHRQPGVHEPARLVTLCASCHARVHRLQSMRYWLPPVLLPFWEEQHPAAPRQLGCWGSIERKTGFR